MEHINSIEKGYSRCNDCGIIKYEPLDLCDHPKGMVEGSLSTILMNEQSSYRGISKTSSQFM